MGLLGVRFSQGAQAVVEQLKEDANGVASIGINSEAFFSEENKILGVAVAGVTPKSIAEATGLRAGDIILELNGRPLSSGDSMKVYCDVLRRHLGDNPVGIRVLRAGEVLEGELYGENLARVSTYNPDTYYTAVLDKWNAVEVEVPGSWHADYEIGNSPSTPDITLFASPDLWMIGRKSSGIPWLAFGVWKEPTNPYIKKTYLDHYASNDLSDQCEHDGRHSFDRGSYKGFYDLWKNCEQKDGKVLSLVAFPPDRGFAVTLQIFASNQTEAATMDRILESFEVHEEIFENWLEVYDRD